MYLMDYRNGVVASNYITNIFVFSNGNLITNFLFGSVIWSLQSNGVAEYIYDDTNGSNIIINPSNKYTWFVISNDSSLHIAQFNINHTNGDPLRTISISEEFVYKFYLSDSNTMVTTNEYYIDINGSEKTNTIVTNKDEFPDINITYIK